MTTTTTTANLMAGALALMGTLHFARPAPFDGLVPDELPGSARTWTYASGIAELAVAAGLAVPATRRAAGWAAAGLFVAVFPGNLNMVRLWWDRPLGYRLIALARLPLQWPMIRSALRVARAAEVP